MDSATYNLLIPGTLSPQTEPTVLYASPFFRVEADPWPYQMLGIKCTCLTADTVMISCSLSVSFRLASLLTDSLADL